MNPISPTAAPDDGAAGTSFLTLRNLSKSYAGSKVVHSLNLDIRKGELLAFLGPSGCGKTTSLRMVAGLTPATSGRILVDGRDITVLPPYRRDMGLVFQSYALFPHMNVAKNVAFGLEMRKVPAPELRERVAQAIALVHLEGLEHRRPAELSGGQQQRVALARALVIRPSILLLDEPLSNLDAKLREGMRTEIRDIQQRLGITTVFVTHDQDEAMTMCDRVAVMNGGRLEQLGTPADLYERPASAFVASFVGRMNKFPAFAEGNTITAPGIELKTAHPANGAVEVMMRPHRIYFDDESMPAGPGFVNRLQGRIVRSLYAGDKIQFDVHVGDWTLVVERSNVGQGDILPVGSDVTIRFRDVDTLVFKGAS